MLLEGLMKNKLLAIILVAVISLLALASCNKCDHPLLEEWEGDQNGHWHPTACEHGEFRSEPEPHVDENEDEKCDLCAEKVKHNHTFESKWTITEDKHWKVATCSHTDIKGDEGAHVDENLDAACDVCAGHVHVLDGAGFCHACNKEIIPINEYDVGSVISATTARTHNVVAAGLDYYQISRLATGTGTIQERIDYVFGINGMHSTRTYPNLDDNGKPTGKTETLDKWVEKVSSTVVKGIATVSVDGTLVDAYPSDYSINDLYGDYYAIPALAEGFNAEQLLLSMYKAYEEFGIEDAVIVHDAAANSYDFSFKALVVKEDSVYNDSGKLETAYTVDYFEVSISFTYADDYTLKTFEIECDCWSNDAGDANTAAGKAEIDIEYYPETNTFAFVKYDAESDSFVVLPESERPRADTYEISGANTLGTREEIELDDGSQYKPETFEIYTNKSMTTPLGAPITIDVTEIDKLLYVKVGPEGSFISFFQYEFETIVTDKNGNRVYGFGATLTGDNINMMPIMPGEYHVTFKALGIEKSVDVTVTAPALKGDKTFTVDVLESYSWSALWNNGEGVVYEFTATTAGTYTFYLPPNLGVVEISKCDSECLNVYPAFDPTGKIYDVKKNLFKVKLEAGEVYSFYVKGAAPGTYTIGYDAP